MSGIAEVLTAHQKVSMGMTSGSPDTCKCGERLYPDPADDEVTLRRDRAFSAHQATMLTAAGFGPVKGEKRLMELAALMAYDAVEEGALREAKAVALEEAADLVEPFSGIGMANGATRGDVATWLRARAAAVRGEG